jgi:alpha 1,3-glucosidase
MIAHKKKLSAGIFWMNPSETWIDIIKTKQDENEVSFTTFIQFFSLTAMSRTWFKKS